MGVLDELRIVVSSLPANRTVDDKGLVVAYTIDRERVLDVISAFEREHPGLVDKTARCDACGAGFPDRTPLRRDHRRRMNVCLACARDAAS